MTTAEQAISRPEVIGRVAAGAALLDEEDPRWWREIDLDGLEMASVQMCILGQRCPLELRGSQAATSADDGPYWAYALALAGSLPHERDYVLVARVMDWACAHGFALDSDRDHFNFGELRDEWVRVITERRAAS